MKNLWLLLMLIFASSNCHSELLYEEGWENPLGTKIIQKSKSDVHWLASNALTSGSCYTKANAGYDSFSVSTKYARSGKQSLRNENHADKKHEECGATDGKSRQEVIYGVNVPTISTDMPNYLQGEIKFGQEIWVGMSFYYPSNEGTINSWWGKGNPRMNIFQLMAHGNSYTPEIFVVLGNSGRVDIQSKYSTNATTEDLKSNPTGSAYFKKDAWNDLVIHHKRGWDNTGILEAWINGVKVTSLINTPVSIRDKPYGYIAAGQYWGTEKNGEIYVQYVDGFKIGGSKSSYAEVDPAASRPSAPSSPTEFQIQ